MKTDNNGKRMKKHSETKGFKVKLARIVLLIISVAIVSIVIASLVFILLSMLPEYGPYVLGLICIYTLYLWALMVLNNADDKKLDEKLEEFHQKYMEKQDENRQ